MHLMERSGQRPGRAIVRLASSTGIPAPMKKIASLATFRRLPRTLGLFFGLAALAAALGAPPLAAQPAEVVKLKLAAGSPLVAGAEASIVAQVEVADHWHTNSNTPTLDFLIPTELALELPAGASGLAVAYPAHKMLKFPYTEEPIAVYDGRFEVKGKFKLAPDAKPGRTTVKAVLAYQACDDKQCLPPSEVEATLEVEVLAAGDSGAASPAAPPAAEPAATPAAPAAEASAAPLWRILLFAVFGGLILNLMPCVLPVLSLKIFGLVKSAGQGRSHLVAGALATTFGVLFSFWILAAAAVGAGLAGAAVGWGVQFQQPGFVAFLAVVVILFSLNMWGLFEIPLPQSLARMGSSGPRQGMAGHFFSGFFATLMATPCSAPFLGTAIGFALGQPAPIVFLVFTAVGLGLALPYLVLAVFPRAARLLPKPGDWMVTFRNLMGFLLAAAAVWLFYILAGQIRAEWVAYVQLALLGLALAAYLLSQAAYGSPRRWLPVAAMVAAAVLTVGLAVKAPAKAAAGASEGKHLAWVAFDEQEAKELAQGGRPVFVDFTADWCLTCKANERLVIDTPEVAAAFERHRVVAMKGDWTSRDDRITDFLKRYGRSAVPFYVLFRPGAEPHAFGEVLTQATLISTVEAAATKTARLD